MINTVLNGDCLIESEKIASGSVDLVLTDPPYGNMDTDGGQKLGIKNWDKALKPVQLFTIANRILRKNGKLVLFSQEPYTSQLITQALPNLPFSYRMIWEKDNFANPLGANKAPVSYFEDILVFSKHACYEAYHPLKPVFNKIQEKHGREACLNAMRTSGRFSSEESVKVHTSVKFGYGEGMVFELMVEELFNHCKKTIDIPFKYNDLKQIDNDYKSKYPSVFNLWEGKSYKSNVLKYKKDYNGYHPTQKPLLLMEDLIKTYSNAGNLVVDLTAGSGSTAVAAITTGRNFIAIEQSEEYYKIIKERINAPQTRLELW